MADSEEEIWKSHPDIPGIEVSTLGNVRSLDRVVSSENGTLFLKGKVLKQSDNGKGYLKVNIPIDGKWTTKKVHRLVAQTFIKNQDNFPEVNHKDCDRTNNRSDNLEWVTHEDNIAYRDKLGHTARNNAPKSPVFAVNLDTLEVSWFGSQSEAGRVLGASNSKINAVIKGKRNKTHGYWFVNADDNAVEVVKSKLHDVGGIGLKIYN